MNSSLKRRPCWDEENLTREASAREYNPKGF
jgi:hypothetical protein